MSLSLYKTMLRIHIKTMAGFAYGAAAYLLLLVWVYPTIGKVKGLNDVLSSMPKSMQKAFGMENGIHSLVDYIAGDFYGLLFVLILMVYTIMLSNRLAVRLVDQGSMAYLLSVPLSRTRIIVTQFSVLLTGLLMVVAAAAIMGIVASRWIVTGADLEIVPFVKLNAMTLLFFSMVSGFSFFFSCLFNDEKRALAVASGISLVSYMLNLAGKLSDSVSWMLHFSFFTAFDPHAIIHGSDNLILKACSLIAAVIIFAIAAVTIFNKKDLPL